MLYLFGCVICLFPLMVYCLVLAWLNQRRGPTLVGGGWDAAGLLLGLSGFFAVGGPAVLAAVRSGVRAGLARDGFASLRQVGFDAPAWAWVWAAYAAALAAGSAAWVLARRRATAVYNAEPAALDAALARALDAVAPGAWSRKGARYAVSGDRPAEVEVEPFAALGHATLHRRGGTAALRRDVEAALAGELAAVDTPPTPVTGWLLSAATACFTVILGALGLIFWVLLRLNRVV